MNRLAIPDILAMGYLTTVAFALPRHAPLGVFVWCVGLAAATAGAFLAAGSWIWAAIWAVLITPMAVVNLVLYRSLRRLP